MFHSEHLNFDFSKDFSMSSENSRDANSSLKQENTKSKFDNLHLKSPAGQINLTAQQHFNNQTVHAFSGENLTFEANNSSRSPNRRERSLQSPGIERQFSDLDEFLKETYEKHGIYNLIRSFVDMEDQLVSTFESLKTLQERKDNHGSGSSKHKVRCFEEINEMEEFSFEAQENIINEFLYNIQNFFIPSESLRIKQNEFHQKERKNEDFSFSQAKIKYSNSKILTKRSQIHNSRSKHIIGGRLKSERQMFSDEKMIKSIHLMNKQVTPLNFEELSINKITQNSLKWTSSEMLGEESIESENTVADHKGQEELLKTIFELRQQILELKQARYDHNGTYSHNSSYYLEGQLGEHYFKSRGNEYSSREDYLQDIPKSKSSFKLFNDFDAKIKYQEYVNKFSTLPIMIKEESQSEDSKRLESNESFKISGLEIIQIQEDKENNPNFLNSQSILYSKTTKLKNLSKQSLDPPLPAKNSPFIESSVVKFMYFPEKECLYLPSNKTQFKEERYMTENTFKILLAKFMDEFTKNFKQIFRVEMQIELILLSLIHKKKGLQTKVYNQFSRLIDWYSELKVQSSSKQESLQKFVSECTNKKTEILQELKKIVEKSR